MLVAATKFGRPALIAVLALTSLVACGSSSPGSGAAQSAANGVVVGANDAHCLNRALGVSDPSICLVVGADPGAGATSANGAAAGGASSAGAGGSADCNLSHDSGYGDTLYNASGDDDDCKYHVTWSATPIQKNQPFTLTVTATNKTTGAPLESIAAQAPGKPALSRIEPFMPCEPSHLAPTSDYEAPVTQIRPGKFTVGPVVFDASGRWVIRYHFYEECFNNVTTPHGHIAFFVEVP
ncbi:MAG TPA: hypothetical protein VGF76_09555 [Polyangiaceae bacterium]